MPSRWDAATHGRSRRVFHYPLPTLMSRNFRLPCTIELQPLSLTLLKMRKVELKYGVGLNHLPSGRFAANAAWLAVQVLDGAHRSGPAGGDHQDPATTLLLYGRTAHQFGAPPHFASSPALALGKPVQ